MSCGVSRHSEASKKITPATMYMLVTICCDCGKMPVFARFVVVQSGKVEYLVTRFVTLIIAYISIELFISFLPAKETEMLKTMTLKVAGIGVHRYVCCDVTLNVTAGFGIVCCNSILYTRGLAG